MANPAVFYVPVAANAGASQWGTDTRRLLLRPDAALDTTTITDHSTGGAVTRTHDPFSTSTTDGTQANFGFALAVEDLIVKTTADASGNNRTGTLIGSVRPTVSASGMTFDGVDRNDNTAGVDCGVTGFGVSTADGSCKVKATIRRSRTGVLEAITCKYGGVIADQNWLLFIDSNNLWFRMVNSSGLLIEAQGTTSLLSGVDYDVEGEWTGAVLRVKVDGVQEGATPALTALQAPDSVTPMLHGRLSGVVTAPFQGTIKNVEMYRGGVLQGQYALTSTTDTVGRRFFPTGTWTLTGRVRENATAGLGKAGCRLDVFLYKVGTAVASRARTLIDSWSSASFDCPLLNAFVTVTAAKSVSTFTMELDETFQISTELNAAGTIVVGQTYTFATGTSGAEAIRVNTPIMGFIFDVPVDAVGVGTGDLAPLVVSEFLNAVGVGTADVSAITSALVGLEAVGVGTASQTLTVSETLEAVGIGTASARVDLDIDDVPSGGGGTGRKRYLPVNEE